MPKVDLVVKIMQYMNMRGVVPARGTGWPGEEERSQSGDDSSAVWKRVRLGFQLA
jgi:hypothetical protein